MSYKCERVADMLALGNGEEEIRANQQNLSVQKGKHQLTAPVIHVANDGFANGLSGLISRWCRHDWCCGQAA